MREVLPALPGRARRAVVTSLGALLAVVATGRSPGVPPRAKGAPPTRALAVGITTAALAVWAWTDVTVIIPPYWPFGDVALLAPFVALTPIAVVLVFERPLMAWRLCVVLFLLASLVARKPDMDVLQPSWLYGPPWLDIALAITLLAVAERHPPRELAWVAVLTLLAATPRDPRGGNVFLLALLVIGPLLAGSTVRLRRRADEHRLRQAEERANTATLQERARIAREMHDVVAHHMSVLALRADSAPYRLAELADDARGEFAELATIARDGLAEMRLLLGVLHAEGDAGATAPLPTLSQVRDLVDRVRATGTPVSLAMTVDPPLPAGLGLSGYRIVQEALSNATRHAAGGEVWVLVTTAGGVLRIDVRNRSGSSTSDPESDEDRPRHGLMGMRERVALLGGSFDAGPTSDGGFAVTATLPFDVMSGVTR